VAPAGGASQQVGRQTAKVRQSLRTLKKEGATQHELSLIAVMVSMIWPLVRPKLTAPSYCRRQTALYRVAPLHQQSPQPRWSGVAIERFAKYECIKHR
jgi:hypothetical protein